MLVADIARAAALLTIPVAYAFSRLGLAQLYVVTFVVGVFDVLFFVSYSTLFVSIVKQEDYLQGHSLLNGSRAMSSVVGQSFAGVLVALLKCDEVRAILSDLVHRALSGG